MKNRTAQIRLLKLVRGSLSFMFGLSILIQPRPFAKVFPQPGVDNSLVNPIESQINSEDYWKFSQQLEFNPQVTYSVQLPMVFNNYTPPVYLRTKIDNITEFLEQCPTNDPAYNQILNDFTIRIDGSVVTDFSCTEPISTIPINQFTQQLITLQVFRTIYYMDPGVPGHLPWTSMSLYEWMASNIGGINLRTAPGYLYCCDIFEGKKYIVQSIQTDDQREYKRYWPGISSSAAFFAHEVRHADGGPGHVTGCEAFPDPTDPAGCDQSYDLSNLGSYGIQYWLNESWLKGYLDVGISCNSADAYEYANWHLSSMNYTFRPRFVDNVPPLVEMPNPPYGGPCFDQ